MRSTKAPVNSECPGTVLVHRHLLLRVKIFKTKNGSQTYVIDPKIYPNSFHSMPTAVSSFTSRSVSAFERARHKAWPCISACQYGFSFLLYNCKKKKKKKKNVWTVYSDWHNFLQKLILSVSYKMVFWLHSSLFTVGVSVEVHHVCGWNFLKQINKSYERYPSFKTTWTWSVRVVVITYLHSGLGGFCTLSPISFFCLIDFLFILWIKGNGMYTVIMR